MYSEFQEGCKFDKDITNAPRPIALYLEPRGTSDVHGGCMLWLWCECYE